MKWFFPLMLFICFVPGLSAQQDSLPNWEELEGGILDLIEVRSHRIPTYNIGQKTTLLDSTRLLPSVTATMADLLQQSNSVFLRAYAPGGLSSASSRGTGYPHTAVIWNGFNLQSPMNGGVDMNLLPAFLFEKASMYQGGGSALFGSGAVGGSLEIRNPGVQKQGHSGAVQLSAGSYQDIGQYLKYNYSKGAITSSIKSYHRAAKNDYRYAPPNGPITRQIQAAFRQFGLLQDNHIRINDRHYLHTWFWYQYHDREIPPNRSARNNKEEQTDKASRLALEWVYLNQKKGYLKSRLAFFDESLNYRSTIVQNGLSRTYRLDWQTQWEQTLNDHWQVNNGLQFIYQRARSAGAFSNQPQRQQYALFSSIRYATAKWAGAFNLRQELVDGQAAPFTASLGMAYQGWTAHRLSARLYRTYNLPTFNDLYWDGAGGQGNAELKAEAGWGAELGWKQSATQAFPLDQQLQLYSQFIDNWIQWLPVSGFNWEPDNVRAVWARGLEYGLGWEHRFQALQIRLALNYQLSLSTIQKIAPGDSPTILNRQLIQTPRHSASFNSRFRYRNISLQYLHFYTAPRFTTADNRQQQPAYQTANLQIYYLLPHLKSQPSLSIKIQNLWNANYEVVPLRPMPLRNYLVELGFRF